MKKKNYEDLIQGKNYSGSKAKKGLFKMFKDTGQNKTEKETIFHLL